MAIELWELQLPLEGVGSEHCALIVDKAIDKIPNITAHRVELNNRRAVIKTSEPQEVLPLAVAAISEAGYGVHTVKKTYPVLNMSCASCAAGSERALQRTPGVLTAAVNYANATARITFIPTITSPHKLKAALQAVGYDLAIDEQDDAGALLEEARQQQHIALRRRTTGAIALSVPLVIIGMFFMDMPYANYIMWALATTVVAVFGRQFFTGAWKQLKHRSGNMDTLVALSTGVAYIFSVFNTLFPGYWHRRGLHAHVYFEASAVVIAFILLGRLLEENAKGNTSAAIKKLMGLQPKTVAIIREDNTEETIDIAEVVIGDTLLVRPGERIAVDGMVSEGNSFVDESTISGEPIPVEKMPGAQVFSGTINQKGSFRFVADKVGGDTVLARIIKTVQDAQGSKAPVQKLADKIAAVFVPVVIGLAVLTFVVWCVAGGTNGFTQGLMAMITVLVIACPCALGLATPTAIMVGVGKGAEMGILIKDAESLELAKKITAVVLDKTGTITEGKPEVADIAWLNDNETQAGILVALEKQSEHPLAEAVVKYFEGVQPVVVNGFESVTGAGAKGVVNGRNYFVGNAKLLTENNISIAPVLQQRTKEWLQQAMTVIYFADDEQAIAAIAIADKIKTTSAAAVRQLQAAGIAVYMLTGDNAATAAAIAGQAGTMNFKAEMLPAQKAEFVKGLQREGHIVAMVGDGINDSNALALADVSIAMGKGSDIAMDVAKMTIISSDLSRIPQAIRLSALTVATIRQNLFWAFVYNVIGIPIAAGVLYPVNGFLLDPMIAGAAMALSSVSVVSNSLRLKWKKL